MSKILNEFTQKIFLVLGTMSLLAVATGMTPDLVKGDLNSWRVDSKRGSSIPEKCESSDAPKDFAKLAKSFEKQAVCTYGGKYGNGEEYSR